MTILKKNRHPRSIPYISSFLGDRENHWIIADVGARDGDPGWAPLEGTARFVGFEPDEAECARLNTGSSDARFYPVALHDRSGDLPFFLTELEYCHGFYGANPAYFGRFPNYVNNSVRDRITVRTTTMDEFMTESRLSHVDFLKIDTEGSELDILRGARNTLAQGHLLGVLSEFWWDPRIKSQPAFTDLDRFMRDAGFSLFDIECQRYPRSTLPLGAGLSSAVLGCPPYRKHGQILTGDALYFRDPVWDLRESPGAFPWNDLTVLRLVGLLDLFGYPDFAIEILDTFRDRFARKVDVDHLFDLLVPPIGGVVLPFDKYWELSAKVFRRRNLAPHIREKLKLEMPRYSPKNRRRLR